MEAHKFYPLCSKYILTGEFEPQLISKTTGLLKFLLNFPEIFYRCVTGAKELRKANILQTPHKCEDIFRHWRELSSYC